jgi:pimeloyl-ACP methyl ester carboxylesterase
MGPTRRKPHYPTSHFGVRTADGVAIRGLHGGHGRERLVVLCHPAVAGQYYAPLTGLAELLHECYDVATFDFRGHGRSGGTCTLDPIGPAQDLRAVVSHFRARGYKKVAVVGFSLGGIAAITNAARFQNLDAVASVGTPPRLPDFSCPARHPHLASFSLRLLGGRFRWEGAPFFTPLEMVPHVSPAPLLLVHGEREFTFPRRDFEAMWEAAGEPRQRLVLAGLGHAELGKHAPDVLRWLSSLPF